MTAQTPTRTLQDVLDSVPNLVDHLYSNRKGSVLKDAVLRQPTEFVAPEFTTWRDEQRAWREGIAFYDQSFHMTTTYLRGPDAQRLLSSLAVNSFETFGVGRSRHFVCCSPDGYLIGDGILYSRRPRGAGARGSGGRPQLGAVLRRDRRVGCVRRGRRDLLPQPRWPAHRVPVSSGRAARAGARRTAHRCSSARGAVVAASSLSPSPAITSGPSGTRWPATRGASSSGPGMRVPRSRRRSWRPEPHSTCAGSGRSHTSRTLWSWAGSHGPCRPSSPATSCAPSVSGCRRPARRRPGLSAAASMHPTSRTTTSRRGSSGTAT